MSGARETHVRTNEGEFLKEKAPKTTLLMTKIFVKKGHLIKC